MFACQKMINISGAIKTSIPKFSYTVTTDISVNEIFGSKI